VKAATTAVDILRRRCGAIGNPMPFAALRTERARL
jgi:hypothetical protein